MIAQVAILPWGDAIEDYLDPIGVPLEGFRDAMDGGWLFGYVEALRSAGVDAAIVCVSRGVRTVQRWRHGPTGAPLVVLPRPRLYDRLMAASPRTAELAPYASTSLPALRRELRALGCRALVCQEYDYARFDACALGAPALGVPVHATFQGAVGPSRRLERAVRVRAVRAAAGLVIGPAAEAERVRHEYGVEPSRIARVFNPIDLRGWSRGEREAARAELGVPDGTLVVVWHGRVEMHRKGLDVLLHAWEVLRERHDLPPRRLVLIGDGAQAGVLRERLAGATDVTWISEYVLDKGRVARLLSAGDVYAFPSRHEGFPVAPLEAMAAGLPLVAADAPGVREIVTGPGEPAGIVVPREDGVALAGALARVLEDAALRADLGRRSRERVRHAFSPEAVGAALRAALHV